MRRDYFKIPDLHAIKETSNSPIDRAEGHTKGEVNLFIICDALNTIKSDSLGVRVIKEVIQVSPEVIDLWETFDEREKFNKYPDENYFDIEKVLEKAIKSRKQIAERSVSYSMFNQDFKGFRFGDFIKSLPGIWEAFLQAPDGNLKPFDSFQITTLIADKSTSRIERITYGFTEFEPRCDLKTRSNLIRALNEKSIKESWLEGSVKTFSRLYGSEQFRKRLLGHRWFSGDGAVLSEEVWKFKEYRKDNNIGGLNEGL